LLIFHAYIFCKNVLPISVTNFASPGMPLDDPAQSRLLALRAVCINSANRCHISRQQTDAVSRVVR